MVYYKPMEITYPLTTTLTYLLRGVPPSEVLLTKKKRDFGVGKWNGPGGKLDPGESVEQALVRECQEEIGVTPLNYEPAGLLEFVWQTTPEKNQRCYLYICTRYSGQIVETEECFPQWWPIQSLPFADMWEDDPHWLPQVLSGKEVNMRFYFDSNYKISKIEQI